MHILKKKSRGGLFITSNHTTIYMVLCVTAVEIVLIHVLLESHSKKGGGFCFNLTLDFGLPANMTWQGEQIFTADVNTVYMPASHRKKQDFEPQGPDSPVCVCLGSPCGLSHLITVSYFYRGVLFCYIIKYQLVQQSLSGATAAMGVP